MAIVILLLNLLVLWPVYTLVLWLPLAIIGAIAAVPLAIRFGHWKISYIPREDGTYWRIFTAPRWLWLWGNDEDGFRSPTVFKFSNPKWSLFYTMYEWAVIRNSVGNLRFIRWLHPPQRKGKVKWRTWGKYTFVWQGICGCLIHNNDNRAGSKGPWWWIGWKYIPVDEDATGWKVYGQGFGTRIERG